VSGLFLEGADWDVEHGCLTKSKPGVLVVELPLLKIIPTEARRLKLQVPSGTPRPMSSSPPPAFTPLSWQSLPPWHKQQGCVLSSGVPLMQFDTSPHINHS